MAFDTVLRVRVRERELSAIECVTGVGARHIAAPVPTELCSETRVIFGPGPGGGVQGGWLHG